MIRQSLGFPMLGILLVALILFAAFPARVFECDAVIYACAGLHKDIVQSTDAGHLAWGGIEWLAADISRASDPPQNPIYLLRWMSMTAALVGAWLMFVFLTRSLRLPGSLAAVLAGCLLFSYSYWHFGLQAEPHILHTLMLIGFLMAAWSLFEAPGRRAAVATGVLLGAATLLHQTTILLVPVVLAALLLATRSTGKSWMKISAWLVGAYFLAAILPYLVVGWFVRDLRTYHEFHEWIMGISSWGFWGNWRPTSPIAAVVGIVRSFVGSHFLLGFEPVRNLAERLFPHASWEDELMVASVVPMWLRLALAPTLFAVLGGAAWLLIQARRLLRKAWTPAPAFAALLLGWLALHTIFFTWWAPERAEFWIAFWLPLIVLMAPAIFLLRWSPRWLFLGMVGLVAVNFGGSIAAQSSGRLEPATLAAVAVDPVVVVGDVMLTDLALSQRAGRFVYSIDIVKLPDSRARAAVVVDSLLQVVTARDRTLYWASNSEVLPVEIGERMGGNTAVPIRSEVILIPLESSRSAEF